MTAINLTRSNRAVGLMNELADLIAAEDSSLELERISRTLLLMSQEARTRSQGVEGETREIQRRQNSRPRKARSFGAALAATAARC